MFLLCAFLFHLANGAMLPQLGEMLAHGDPQKATPFMSACMIVTQIVMSLSAAPVGRWAGIAGRRPLLLLAFACLPVRGFLYTLTHATVPLVSIQVLDGVANALFMVVSVLIIKDLTRGTGRFNLGAGMLATCVGLGQTLSPGLGGEIVQRYGFNLSFLSLGAIAVLPLAIFFMAVPETLEGHVDTT
jgi:MFS family permease